MKSQLANSSMTKLLQEISSANAKLAVVPQDINSYVDFNCFLAETQKQTLPEIEANALRVSGLLDILKRVSLRIDATTKTLFAELSQGLAGLRTQLQFAEYSVEGSIKRFQDELEACAPVIKDKLVCLQQQLEDTKLYEADTTLEDVQAVLLGLEKQIQDLKTEVEKCKRCEDVLRVDATPFEGFEETVQLFEDLKKCLEIKKSWTEFASTMGQELFWKADIPQLQATLQGFSKSLQGLAGVLGSQPLYQTLQASLSSYKETLAVATALRNPALRQRHWDAIKGLLGDEINLKSETLLLSDLANIKRLKETPEILERGVRFGFLEGLEFFIEAQDTLSLGDELGFRF
ncbi:Dynein heavy chain 6, axonemal, related [Eimeria praecox]|uniref:Dynein heavy chain 6, axonemal, related n=1 Tax=Eimeria praecox TaxID=51316 RepID=U6G2E6_9EIME|nr:Dynein heavy chain 6, axonemal, related [Eimeria praecox]